MHCAAGTHANEAAMPCIVGIISILPKQNILKTMHSYDVDTLVLTPGQFNGKRRGCCTIAPRLCFNLEMTTASNNRPFGVQP